MDIIGLIVILGIMIYLVLSQKLKASTEKTTTTSVDTSSSDNTTNNSQIDNFPLDSIPLNDLPLSSDLLSLVPSYDTSGDSSLMPLPISNDRNSWPTGDKIWDICQAIAIAEGYNIITSVPYKLNNPGDISDGYKQFGGEYHSGSYVTRFPDAQTGWKWLYDKIQNILDNKSSVYKPDMTWIQIAQKYAGDWQNWVNNVTNDLNIDPNSKFIDYFNS